MYACVCCVLQSQQQQSSRQSVAVSHRPSKHQSASHSAAGPSAHHRHHHFPGHLTATTTDALVAPGFAIASPSPALAPALDGAANVSANAIARCRSLGNASVATATAGARRSSSQSATRQHECRLETERGREQMRRRLAEWYQLHPHLSPVTPIRLPTDRNPTSAAPQRRR